MLTFDSVKLRLEKAVIKLHGIQLYDFTGFRLFINFLKKENCLLQLGGSDQ